MRSISARLLLVGFVLLPAACATAPEPAVSSNNVPRARDNSLPQDLRSVDGVPVFLGVANRTYNRDEEEAAAVEHIAQQASRYVQISARYEYVSQRGNDGIGYLDDISTQWDEELVAELIESVDILSTTRTDTATLVTARVTGLSPAPDVRNIDLSGGEDSAPTWVFDIPEVPGYLVAVGTARQRRTARNTVDFTDQEALKGILIQTGSTLRMVENRKSVERRGSSGSVTVAEEAQATLVGFQVLARHASPDGTFHYSLAIAKED